GPASPADARGPAPLAPGLATRARGAARARARRRAPRLVAHAPAHGARPRVRGPGGVARAVGVRDCPPRGAAPRARAPLVAGSGPPLLVADRRASAGMAAPEPARPAPLSLPGHDPDDGDRRADHAGRGRALPVLCRDGPGLAPRAARGSGGG